MNTTIITVAPEMTVQELIDAGVVTLTQLQTMANRAGKGDKSLVKAERAEFAQEVYALMCEASDSEWRNKNLLVNWFPGGKSSDVDTENARKKKHAEISRALSDLASDGLIIKHNNTGNTASTFYTVIAEKMPAKNILIDLENPPSDDEATDA